MRHSVLVLCAALTCAGPAAPADTSIEELVLANGLRVTLVHAPAAPRQLFFTLVPSGLLADRAGEAQLAHLVEHALVRTTDAELGEPDLAVNGETTAGHLRLETVAAPERWPEALERHATWIAARTFDAALIARELPRIAAEQESTVARGATHKWACAAWTQVVRHGRAHARVSGDVAGASAEQVARWARERLAPASLRFVAVGPVELAPLAAAIRERLGALPIAAPSASSSLPPGALRGGALTAGWDLAARHLLEWYPLPASDAAERVAGSILAQALSGEVARDSGWAALGAMPLVELWTAPEGRLLVLSASLPTPARAGDVEAVRARFREAVEACRGGRGPLPARLLLQSLRLQAEAGIDLGAMRQAWERRGGAPELLEGQVLLSLAYEEELIGVPFTRFGEAFGALEAERLATFIAETVVPARAASLLLEPWAE